MSVSEDLRRNAYDVRRRLRNPPNAVVDLGIDLKRKPEPIPLIQFVPPELESTQIAENPQPVEIGEPLEIPAFLPVREIQEVCPKYPSIRQIQVTVSKFMLVSIDDMKSERRLQKSTRARQIAMWLCKQLTPQSYPSIGRHFGGRDHTTCLHAVRRIDELRETDPVIAFQTEDLMRLFER
jgi:hypothetical protein